MMRPVLLLLLVGLLLVGCGQKGPLFLPGDAPESQSQDAFGLDTKDDDADKQNSSSADQSPAGEPTDETSSQSNL